LSLDGHVVGVIRQDVLDSPGLGLEVLLRFFLRLREARLGRRFRFLVLICTEETNRILKF
jgi:hypothetical protein